MIAAAARDHPGAASGRASVREVTEAAPPDVSTRRRRRVMIAVWERIGGAASAEQIDDCAAPRDASAYWGIGK